MVSAAVWVCVFACYVCDGCATLPEKFDLRENLKNMTNSLLNRFWSWHASMTLLNRYFLLIFFS